MSKDASAALKAGKFASAIDIYTRMLTVHPDSAGVLFNRSLAHAQLENHKAACEDLQKVPKPFSL